MAEHHMTPAHWAWQHNGVAYLLMPDDLPPPLSLCHARVSVPARAGAPAQEVVSKAASFSDAQYTARQHAAQLRQKTQAMPQTTTAPTSQQAKPVPPLPSPDHWPLIWQQRLTATKIAPVLWTYWHLGEDMCGTPDAARRGLLQRLLADLQHPGGTHSFWPMALPQAHSGTLEANTAVFWAGAQLLKARAIIIMGQEALIRLELPSRLRPFQQTRHNGRMLIILPEVDFLIAETHHYDSVREFLRQALMPFAR